MYVGKYQNAPEHKLNYVALKKNIYEWHLAALEELFQKSTSFNYHAVIENFDKEKNYVIPSIKNIGIEQFIFLFNLLNFAHTQKNTDAVDFITNAILELYKKNILENKEHYISIEYKIIENFNWSLFYQSLMRQKKFESFDTLISKNFLTPEETGKNLYEVKSYNIELYKFYLKSLCIAYRQSNRGVENTIIQILKKCFLDNPSAQSIDIFATSYEKSYDGNTNLAVFPLLIEISNTFRPENQKELISMILNQGNIGILFSAYNLIDYEKGRVLIKDYIAKNDFTPKINEIYNFSEFIDIAANVANSRIDEEFEKLLFERLNEITKAKFSEKYVNEYTYRIELLNLFQLYKKGDLDSLGKYVFPYKDETGLYKEYKNAIQSARLFYLACIHFEKWLQKPDDENSKFLVTSIRCFSDLVSKYPNTPKYKYYKLYVESFALNKKSEKKEIDALIELVTQELKNAKENTELLLYTKLRLYTLERDANTAYCFFETLDDNLKKDVGFANLVINCLVDENLVEPAIAIYNNIDPAFYNRTEYKELSSLLPINQIMADLQKTYYRILCLPDDSRFSILPEKLNNHQSNIGTYVLNEIKHALNKTLKKLDLVEKITTNKLSEDNISDLLELEINGRLSMLDYKLENQDRSGKAAGNVNAGEIDLEINLDDFSIIIEAVKYSRGSTERKKHIEKTFNYDPSKKYIFDLIYFDVNQNFENSWITVKQEIDDANYPAGYEKLSTTDLPSHNSGIKMAVSKHNGGLVFYHIMANFYYAKK